MIARDLLPPARTEYICSYHEYLYAGSHVLARLISRLAFPQNTSSTAFIATPRYADARKTYFYTEQRLIALGVGAVFSKLLFITVNSLQTLDGYGVLSIGRGFQDAMLHMSPHFLLLPIIDDILESGYAPTTGYPHISACTRRGRIVAADESESGDVHI